MRRILLPTLALIPILLGFLAGCRSSTGVAADTGLLEVEISQVAGATPLAPGQTLASPAGESLTVTRLAYYLSNLRLRRSDGGYWSPRAEPDSDSGYWLIDLARPETGRIALAAVPAGEYVGLELMIGVDPARSRDGAQTGVLDPQHGMFWTWATGYIHFKLEGHSPQSQERDGAVSLHIGGQDAARSVYLPFASKPLRVAAELRSTVHLHADVAAFLGGDQPLTFADAGHSTKPADSLSLAGRLTNLLSVDHLHHAPRDALAGR